MHSKPMSPTKLRSFERHLKPGFQAEWSDKHQKVENSGKTIPPRLILPKKFPTMKSMNSDLSNSLTAIEQTALSNCRRLPARFDVAQAPAPLKWRTDNVPVNRVAKKPGVVLSRRARHALKHSGVGDAARTSKRLRQRHAF